MDGEQAARWAAAQEEVPVGADLVAAARRQLEFLAEVDRRRWLYEGPLLDRAIRRYKACWLPLLAKHTQAPVVDGPLVVPLDCEWVWHCHRLSPVQYIRDCKKVYGRILNNDNVESSTRAKSNTQSEKVWKELYPQEPFELKHTHSSETTMDVNPGATESISYDLVSAVKRQSSFYYQVGTPTMHDERFLVEALARYKGFLYLIKMNLEKGEQRFRVPTYDVDIMWHTHQLHPVTYCKDMLKLLGKVLEHDDTDADRSEGKKLDVGFTETTKQFESTFGVRYWKAGCMYRGNMPSPVTSTPLIFSTELGHESDIFGIQKELNALKISVVELYLQIVDIKNLPSAVQKENVYVWFTKNQSDMIISDGGRLDISTVTGKNTGASLQCEPTGELVLTVMIDQAPKKPEPIGKVSIQLQELIGPDSKLCLERWFELRAHGGHATSPPVSLRVAASSTVPRSAQKVFSMVRMEPFSLKSCLLPLSTKDQKIRSGIRFVYDCGTELIRLQIREHKAKNDIAFQELMGVLKSSKRQFHLAAFKENKWTLNSTDLSITESDGTDECILQLKDDNKMIKLYQGRRLEYERRCCGAHSKDGSAVTAVKFCAEHPYGKAVALLDSESQLIMVNEDWFLLPWMSISFLFMDAGGKDSVKLLSGAVQKAAVSGSDTAIVSETQNLGAGSAAVAPAQCGTVFTGGDKVMAACKADHGSSGAHPAAVASGENGHSESAGCGSDCGGGNCGPVVAEDSKPNNAKSGGCGSGCGGGCGGGGGCGTLFKESTKAGEGQAKSGGCGSGCGGGCGGAGACGTLLNSNAIGGQGQAKSAGCGSGCGGGCCNGMIIEGSKMSSAKSSGCGSGCGGGCGGGGGCGTLFNSSTAAGQNQTKPAGCGSGCGGGCGGMVIEGPKTTEAKSGGRGSGCGGGCGVGGGCGTLFNSSTAAGQGLANSAGCGSGCGSGCGGGMIVEGSKANHVKSSGCGSGCGGGCGGGGGCGTMFNSSTAAGQGQAKSGGCGSGCGGGGCGGMVIEGSKSNYAKSGGCGSGCGGGCGSGIMFNVSTMAGGEGDSKSGGCGSGCGGGCGTMFNA